MTIFAGKDALLKVDISGTWTTVAYLTQCDLSQSADIPTAGDLIGQRQPQHTPTVAGFYNRTLTGSGYASDDAALEVLQDSVTDGTSVSVRLYVDATSYYQATARVTDLSYSGGKSGAVNVSISLILSDTTYT